MPLRCRRARTPTVLQMEAVECGAAALGIILGYYGRIAPLAELRQACGVSRDGSSAANIVKAAQLYGLTARGYKKSLDALRSLAGPYIVFWNFNHFLVVEGMRRDRVYLNDPESGPRTVSLDAFDQGFTGVALVFEPGPDFAPGGRRPSLLGALRRRLRASAGALVYCFLAGLLLVIPGLALPIFTQLFVDHVLIQEQADWLQPLLLGLIIAAVGRGWLLRLQLRQLRRLKLKLATVMTSQFLWRLLHLPVGFYAQRFAGEISQRVALNDKVADALSGRLAVTAIDALLMVCYAALMAHYDAVLTAIGVVLAGLNFAALHMCARRRIDTHRRLLQDTGKLGATTIAGLQAIDTLKASALEDHFFTRWAGHHAKAIDAEQALGMTHQALSVLPVVSSALATMLVLCIGGLRVMEGHLSIGMLVAFQALMQNVMTPVTRLVDLGETMQELRGDLERLDDVLDHPAEPELQSGPRLASVPQGAVEIRDLTFGYSPVAPPLIDAFNLSLKPGQWVALVGASGSGKSTVAKLVAGLYQPWRGDIRFDGVPRPDLPRLALAQGMAIVDQDIRLYAGTVRDNLTLWDPTVPTQDLVRACKDAAIHDTIVALPEGYDSMLLEGAANLSGGQRQRLEIARALARNPSILILDEATNALDAETEAIVSRHLRRRGCACIVVAHRLSTIRDCDEIIVLTQGQVAERGCHRALLAANGAYTQLLHTEGAML